VQGAVAPERLRNFHKLERETARDRASALQRRAQVQVWKQRARAARERARDKR
jgi:ribosome biogenesis GTPase